MSESVETEEREDPMLVAKTILQQLGGARFVRFTGARHLIGGENFLIFQLPKHDRGINKVQITLMPIDTCKIKFWKNADVRRPESLEVIEDVYFDQLQELFTEVTGLLTKL